MYHRAEMIAATPVNVFGPSSAFKVPALVELWRGRAVIIGTVVAMLLLTVAFALLAPVRYTAVAQILVDPNELRVLDRVLRSQTLQSESQFAQTDSALRVLTSDNVVLRVIGKLNLTQDPEFTQSKGLAPISSIVRLLFPSRPTTSDPTLETLRAFKKRLSAKRIERTYVIDVSFWARDPKRAAQINNALLEAFMDEQAAASAEAARRVTASLSGRLNELKERVLDAEKRVETYKKLNKITMTSGQPISESQVRELSSQLVAARALTEKAKVRFEKIVAAQSSGDPGSIADAIYSRTITALRGQLAEIARRQGELSMLGERHPHVLENRSQMRNLHRMIDEELGRIAASAKNDYERAAASEAALEKSLDTLKTTLEGTNLSLLRLQELEREVQANRAIYEAFLARTREVSEQEQLDTTNIRVISPPHPPKNRSFPPRLLFLLAGGLVIGLTMGAGFVLASARYRSEGSAPSAPWAADHELTSPSGCNQDRTKVQSAAHGAPRIAADNPP